MLRSFKVSLLVWLVGSVAGCASPNPLSQVPPDQLTSTQCRQLEAAYQDNQVWARNYVGLDDGAVRDRCRQVGVEIPGG